MTDDQLKEVLHRAFAPPEHEGRADDLWTRVAARCDEPPRWSYVDLGLVAAVGTVLALFPDWIWVLAYSL
jgi:hypothetical protein